MKGNAEAVSGLSLRRNSAWTLVGNGVYAGCQWGMLILITRLTSPHTVGQFALALAVTAPVILFTDMALRAGQVTDARHEHAFGEYFTLRLTATGVAMIVITGIALALWWGTRMAPIILAVGLAKGIESISDILHGLFQKHERMDRVAVSMMMRGVLGLAGLGGALLLIGRLYVAALAMAGMCALVLLLYDAPQGRKMLRGAGGAEALRPRWHPGALARLAWLCFPLGIVQLLGSLNANTSRYFVAHYSGKRELGIFAAMCYLGAIGGQVAAALGQSASARLARYYAEGQARAYARLMGKLVGIGTVLGALGVLVAMAAGRWILTVLYGPAYAQQPNVLVLLMLSAGVSHVASFLGFGMTACRYFRVQPFLIGFLVALNAASCALVVPRYGLAGAACVSVGICLLQAVSGLLVNLHALRNVPDTAQERMG